MAENPYPWCRLYSEAGGDPKFDIVADETGLDRLVVVGAWTILMCLANGSPVRGSLYVTFLKRYSNNALSAILRFDSGNFEKLMKSFISMDIFELDENGAYRFKNWEKRQFTSDSSTERVKKYREKQEKEMPDETLQQRSGNVSPSVSVNLLSVKELLNDSLKREQAFSEFSKLSAYMANRLNIGEFAGGTEKWKVNIQRLFDVGITPIDIEDGLQWMDENNRPVRGLASVIGSVLTAKGKRNKSKSKNNSGGFIPTEYIT